MKSDLDKLILGFVIGGLISGSAFYLMKANDKQRKAFFKKIEKVVQEVGETLKESSPEDKEEALEDLMQSLPKKGNWDDLLTLTALGINLWKKWR